MKMNSFNRAQIQAFIDRLLGSYLPHETLVQGYLQIDANRGGFKGIPLSRA
jgi:hypothetical protein